jgi:arylsulfatase A-like enzyme
MGDQLNLLFIFTDQQRYDTMACYGNEMIQSPNLNRLADESVVFDRAYVTQPICTPARSSIMTGLYPHTTGCTSNNIPLRAEFPTIAEMVSPEYHRAYIGKWHLGDEVIAQHGFETWISTMDRYRQHYTDPAYLSQLSSYYHFLVEHGFEPDKEHEGARIFSRRAAARMPEEFTKARFVGRETARFLRVCGGRPFIAYANFFEPHPPHISPFDDLYPPEELVVGASFRRRPPENAALANRLKAEAYLRGSELHNVDIATEAGWRAVRAKYFGQVTLVDRAVGEILQALDETGLWENTIIVFTSDHGDMMGDQGMFQKGPMYDGSTRVPLLVRLPGKNPGQRRIYEPVSQADLLPTLLDLLDQRTPKGLHGKSWRPYLEGAGKFDSGDVVMETYSSGGSKVSKWLRLEQNLPDLPWERMEGPWRTIISPDRFKLNLSPVDQCELYDLDSDPDERINLFDLPEQQARIRDMAARLRAWQARTSDTAELPAI